MPRVVADGSLPATVFTRAWYCRSLAKTSVPSPSRGKRVHGPSQDRFQHLPCAAYNYDMVARMADTRHAASHTRPAAGIPVSSFSSLSSLLLSAPQLQTDRRETRDSKAATILNHLPHSFVSCKSQPCTSSSPALIRPSLFSLHSSQLGLQPLTWWRRQPRLQREQEQEDISCTQPASARRAGSRSSGGWLTRVKGQPWPKQERSRPPKLPQP